MTKRELIEALEALDCDDDVDVIIDEDHYANPGDLTVKIQNNPDELLIIISNPRGVL